MEKSRRFWRASLHPYFFTKSRSISWQVLEQLQYHPFCRPQLKPYIFFFNGIDFVEKGCLLGGISLDLDSVGMRGQHPDSVKDSSPYLFKPCRCSMASAHLSNYWPVVFLSILGLAFCSRKVFCGSLFCGFYKITDPGVTKKSSSNP